MEMKRIVWSCMVVFLFMFTSTYANISFGPLETIDEGNYEFVGENTPSSEE